MKYSMDIVSQLQKLTSEALKTAFDLDTKPNEIHIERPADDKHGDFSTNVAMTLAKELKQSPRDIAGKLIDDLNGKKNLQIRKVELAGPGFINFYLNESYFFENLKYILKQDDKYGQSNLGVGKKVMIEFGQPNTHKAFHVGHLKSAISGLSMVKLHENLGYEVIKANYFGDIGMQVAKTTWAYMEKDEPEGIEGMDVHERMRYIDDCYVHGAAKFKEDEKAESEIREINKDIYAEKDNEAIAIYKKLRKWSLEHQAEVWKILGVSYDREYPESEVYKEGLKIVNEYKGKIFTESKGAWIYNGEKEGLTTWVFLTKEGNPTYSAKDVALGKLKFGEFSDLHKSFITTSVEQVDYFNSVIAVLNKIVPETIGKYFHIPFGWMLFNKRKASSRSGELPKGMDIIEEVQNVAKSKISRDKKYSKPEESEIIRKVGLGGLKFFILSHEFHKDINYDPDEFMSIEGYSVPYILYTNARAKSILRKAGDLSDVDELELPSEIEANLMRKLEQYPEVAKNAGTKIMPHLVCSYLYEVAQMFNRFYTEVPVLAEEKAHLRESRLALVKATSTVLKNGLNLLGIEIVERM